MADSRVKPVAPDFLSIGMQKAGTGFLFEMLSQLAEVRLPVRKEIHHFDRLPRARERSRFMLEDIARQLGANDLDDEALGRFYHSLKPRWPVPKKVRFFRRRERLDRETIAFLRCFSDYLYGGETDDAYLQLFAPYQGYITGDITPGYSALDDQAVRHVRQVLPQTKIILCVREPVSRLWSQINMQTRRDFKAIHQRSPKVGDFDEFNAMLGAERLHELLGQDHFLQRSFPTVVYKRWSGIFDPDAVLVINFQDLISQPEAVVGKIGQFLQFEPGEIRIPPKDNQGGLRVSIDQPRRNILEAALGSEIAEYDRMFAHHHDRI